MKCRTMHFLRSKLITFHWSSGTVFVSAALVWDIDSPGGQRNAEKDMQNVEFQC